MIRAKRENLIALPVVAGLLHEWALWAYVTGASSWQAEYLIDTRAKTALFVLTFFLFWAVVPRSKRLAAFMVVLAGSCALNVLYLWPPSYNEYYELLTAVRFGEVLGFGKVYRAVEVFVLFSWIGGAKDNVYYLICRARHHAQRVSVSNNRGYKKP